jgi:predicted neuraminidase
MYLLSLQLVNQHYSLPTSGTKQQQAAAAKIHSKQQQQNVPAYKVSTCPQQAEVYICPQQAAKIHVIRTTSS